MQQIGSIFNSNPTFLEMKFHQIKIEDSMINENSVIKLIQNSDIYIMSYVFSEIFADKSKLDKFRDLVLEIFKHAESGSKIIFIDRNEYRIKNELEKILRSAGLSNILIGHTFQDSKFTFSKYDILRFNFRLNIDMKQVYNLSNFWKYICSNHFSPKLEANAFWIVGTVKNA